MNSKNSNSEKLPLVPTSIGIGKPEDFLPPVNNWITFGGIGLVSTFFSLFTLSAFFKYNVTVKVPVLIRPSGEVTLVQVAREGIIKSIEVKDNQFVRFNDVIVYLDDSQLQSQKKQLEGDIAQGLTQLREIDKQLENLDNRIVSETARLERIKASAKAELKRAQREYQELQVTTVTELIEAEAAFDLAQDEFNRYQELAKTGIVSQLQISEKQANLKTTQARLKRVQQSLNPINANVEIALEKVAEVEEQMNINFASLNQEKSSLIALQAQTKNQVENNYQQLKQIEIELEKSVIRAPTSGFLQKATLRNSQQVLQTGDTIASIMPSDSPLDAKAFVSSRDINQVQVGQQVKIRISACPYTDYGTLEGKIISISSDVTDSQTGTNPAEISPLTPSSTENIFRVTIQPNDLKMGTGNLECLIKVGMEGRADIVTGRETLLTLILRKARLLTDL